jgi:hypothetical protein
MGRGRCRRGRGNPPPVRLMVPPDVGCGRSLVPDPGHLPGRDAHPPGLGRSSAPGRTAPCRPSASPRRCCHDQDTTEPAAYRNRVITCARVTRREWDEYHSDDVPESLTESIKAAHTRIGGLPGDADVPAVRGLMKKAARELFASGLLVASHSLSLAPGENDSPRRNAIWRSRKWFIAEPVKPAALAGRRMGSLWRYPGKAAMLEAQSAAIRP